MFFKFGGVESPPTSKKNSLEGEHGLEIEFESVFGAHMDPKGCPKEPESGTEIILKLDFGFRCIFGSILPAK